MPKSVTVVLNQDTDESVIQQLAAVLRANNSFARQIRDFADTIENDAHPAGLKFQPKPGQLLACHFGLGFQTPEIVKTRPVLVISPKPKDNSKLCTVVPISSQAPRTIRPFHYKLPEGVVPGGKYEDAWIKGDLVQTVGLHRLDRFKLGFRHYESLQVSDEVLKEVRRCVLHATGMHFLTQHLT